MFRKWMFALIFMLALGMIAMAQDSKTVVANVSKAMGYDQLRSRWVLGRVPTTGAALVTAGDVIFFGDLNRRFRAFDADNAAGEAVNI